MQNQYPHVIKSPKPKQSNAWRSNSVPNVYKNLNHRVNHFKSNLSGDIEERLIAFVRMVFVLVQSFWG